LEASSETAPQRAGTTDQPACSFQSAQVLIEMDSFVIKRFPPPAGHLAAFCDGMDAGAKRGRSRRADHQ
jgi:hypothetical protein